MRKWLSLSELSLMGQLLLEMHEFSLLLVLRKNVGGQCCKQMYYESDHSTIFVPQHVTSKL